MKEILIIILLSLALVGMGILFIKKMKEKNEDIQDEKERSAGYKKILDDSAELAEKAKKIDKSIQEKKDERKKMSKAQKIAAANSRTNSD